jgi:hypothetical protein
MKAITNPGSDISARDALQLADAMSAAFGYTCLAVEIEADQGAVARYVVIEDFVDGTYAVEADEAAAASLDDYTDFCGACTFVRAGEQLLAIAAAYGRPVGDCGHSTGATHAGGDLDHLQAVGVITAWAMAKGRGHDVIVTLPDLDVDEDGDEVDWLRNVLNVLQGHWEEVSRDGRDVTIRYSR